MPTLEIQGQKVSVDDSFLKLSPEDQNKTVDEIAGNLKLSPGVSRETQSAPGSRTLVDMANHVASSAAEGVPFIGGARDSVNAAINAVMAPAVEPFMEKGPNSINDAPGDTWTERLGNRYAQSKALLSADRERFAADHPIIDTAAKIGGGILGTAPLIAAAPAAFGVGGASLLPSTIAGATSGGLLGGTDALVRGEDPVKGAMFGAGGGAAGPLIGKAVGGVVGKALDDSIAKTTSNNELASAAARQGVDFPTVAATDSLIAQRGGAALKEIPVLGDPIVKASRIADQQMGDALTRVEQGYGSGSAFNAGDAAKTGLVDWITGKSGDITKRLYQGVDALVDPTVTNDLSATRNMVANIAAGRQQAALSGPGKASELVLDAVQRPGGLNYEGIKTLRTSIGEMMDSGVLPSDISKTELKRVYGALTTDIRQTVENAGGPDALKAFNKANSINVLVSQRREALAKIVGVEADAAPEKVVDRLVSMASGNARADYQKLLLARKTIGSDNWDEVASSAVSKLGRDVEGNFSAPRFLTAYGKLSPNGKAMLFGSTGKSDLAQSLDDIAKLSSKAKALSGFGNPSGTGRVLGGLSVIGAGLSSPHLAGPAAFGAWLAAKGLSRAISVKPATLRLAAQNADIGKLLEHAATGGAVGASTDSALTSKPPQISQPSPMPIQ